LTHSFQWTAVAKVRCICLCWQCPLKSILHWPCFHNHSPISVLNQREN